MKTRDEYTALAYDITYKGTDSTGALHLAHNGDVKVADVPEWCVPLAREAEQTGNVVLAQEILRQLR